MRMPVEDTSGADAYTVGLARWCMREALRLAGFPSELRGYFLSEASSHGGSLNPIFELAKFQENPDALELPFSTVGIMGAGLMGTTIAARHLARGFRVILYDPIPAAIRTAKNRVEVDLLRQVPEKSRVEELLERLICVSEPGPLHECACVMEAVPEEIGTKRQVLQLVEPLLSSDALLLTNTSTIPVSRMATELRTPARLCGFHFLHPVRERPLIEIIPHGHTSESVVTAVARHALKLGKVPILVNDMPGFVVNRLLFAYLNEGLNLLQAGNVIAEVDAAATASGFAMGPLRIIDEIGLDTVWAAGKILWDAFPDRVEPSPILVTLMKKRRFGRKVGRGFYRYQDSEPWGAVGEPDPELEAMLRQWSDNQKYRTPEDPGARLLAAMAREAVCVFAEGATHDPQPIDAAAVFGLGFPTKYGGPLYWAMPQGLHFMEESLARSKIRRASGDTPTQLFNRLSLAIRQTMEEAGATE